MTELRHSQIESGGSSIHVVEAGDPAAPPVVLLHGWPECWRSWRAVMELAEPHVHAVALDLPGIGGSAGESTDGSKHEIAGVVYGVVEALGLRDVTLVGQDAGGMVAYAYARAHDLARVVIADVVIPGLGPWDAVLANPYMWHFAFHGVPALPERLVSGREAEYFDYFFDAVSADPTAITAEARSAYVEAYSRPAALTAGFSWYRTFPQDVLRNRQATTHGSATPVLYLRGEHEGGDMGAYADGFRDAGLVDVSHGRVAGAGHFTQEEAPEATWRLIADFMEATVASEG